MINHEFKTDVREQMDYVYQNHVGNGQVEAWDIDKKLFDKSIPESEKEWALLGIPTGLACYLDKSLEGWKCFLDVHASKRWSVNDQKFYVEQAVLTGLGNDCQHVDDDVYYFKSLLDDTWSSQIKIKLEGTNCGEFDPITANYAFQCMGTSLSRWLKNQEIDSDHFNGHTRFFLPFFDSLLNDIDPKVYSFKLHRGKDNAQGCSKATLRNMQMALNRIIAFSHKPETGDEFFDKRIAVAKEFYALFESRKKQIPNWKKCVDFNLEHARKQGYL